MEGNNELRLCQAEMKVALQMYVNHLMPNAETVVESVEENSNDHDFIVKLRKAEGD